MFRRDLKKICVLGLFASFAIVDPVVADWTHVLDTGLTVTGSQDSNVYNTSDDPTSGMTDIVAPTVAWRANEGEDAAFIEYVPVFTYYNWKFERSERENVNGGLTKYFSNRFVSRFDAGYTYYDEAPTDVGSSPFVSDRFARAERDVQLEVANILFPELGGATEGDYLYVLANIDERYAAASPTDQARVDALLTDTGERRRRDDGHAGLELEYEYRQNSQFLVGYTYYKLRNKSSNFVPRETHTPEVSIAHWFNEQWQANALLSVVDTDYEYDTIDDTAKALELGIDYVLSSRNSFFVDYGHRVVDYKDSRGDFTTLNGEFGWVHHFNQQHLLEFTGTGVYEDRVATTPDERRVATILSLERRTERGVWSLDGGWGYGEYKEGSVAEWRELRRHYDANLEYERQLWQDFRGGFRFGWETQQVWGRGTGNKTTLDGLDVNTHFTWIFWRYWQIQIDYTFYEQQSDITGVAEYRNHVVAMELAWRQDLFRF